MVHSYRQTLARAGQLCSLGARQPAEHKATPALPPPTLHPAKQHLHHCSQQTNKNQQEHNKKKQLFSLESLCLKFTASHTWACGGMLWCLREPASLLYSLPSPVFLSSASLALTRGPAVSISEKGLDINV